VIKVAGRPGDATLPSPRVGQPPPVTRSLTLVGGPGGVRALGLKAGSIAVSGAHSPAPLQLSLQPYATPLKRR
jgi:hypothetical protein